MSKFSVGERVVALTNEGRGWVRHDDDAATVIEVMADGRFAVEWDDGDVDDATTCGEINSWLRVEKL